MIKRIKITAASIERYKGGFDHPIEEAINKFLNNNCYIQFDSNRIYIEDEASGDFINVEVPEEIKPFIRKIYYDKGEPFSFDLFIPNNMLKSRRRK